MRLPDSSCRNLSYYLRSSSEELLRLKILKGRNGKIEKPSMIVVVVGDDDFEDRSVICNHYHFQIEDVRLIFPSMEYLPRR